MKFEREEKQVRGEGGDDDESWLTDVPTIIGSRNREGFIPEDCGYARRHKASFSFTLRKMNE